MGWLILGWRDGCVPGHTQRTVAVFNVDCLIPDADEIVREVRSLHQCENKQLNHV